MEEINKYDLAKEIEDIASLLNMNNLCIDTDPLYKAHGMCLEKSDDTTWHYRIDKLVFRIPTIGHTIPNNAEDISLALSVKARGNFNTDGKIRNPLNDLELNIELNGSLLNEKYELVHLIASWHLDKHLPQGSEELTKYIHPEYHMTYGGRKMWNLTGYEYGQSLVLPTPRLCHPPLDGILGIDFVIQHYLKREMHKELTQSIDYQRLISKAQNRFWRPYYLTIAKAYGSGQNFNFNNCITPLGLVPNLIAN